MISSFFGKKNSYFGTKTFTYYLPSPPFRKNGYQEKEFDHLMEAITKLGFEIIDYKVASHSSEEKSGVWIVCHLGAKTADIFNQRIDFTSQADAPLTTQEIQLDPSIIHD